MLDYYQECRHSRHKRLGSRKEIYTSKTFHLIHTVILEETKLAKTKKYSHGHLLTQQLGHSDNQRPETKPDIPSHMNNDTLASKQYQEQQ